MLVSPAKKEKKVLRYSVEKSELGLHVLRVYYNNNFVEVDIINFFKDPDVGSLFSKTNEYIQLLPTPIQERIFSVFSEVINYDNERNYSDYSAIYRLEEKVKELVELFNYEGFKAWFRQNLGELYIPDDIKSEFVYDIDLNVTKEKTYIRSEYIDYIALILFIRLLLPILIDYYNYIRNFSNFYYYQLFMLFVRSEIYTSPEIQKLKTYIEHNQMSLQGNVKLENVVINVGLSDDDIIDFLVAEIIFNKLISIDFYTKQCNIISYTFNTIKHKGDFRLAQTAAIRGKSLPGDSDKEDISYFEDYRKTSSVPIGTIVEIQHALSDNEMIINSIGYKNFDYEMYQRELSILPILMEKRLDNIQIYLLGWFLNKYINPRALYYIEYRRLIELAILAKVILINNNQPFIGLFLTSVKVANNSLINVVTKSSLNRNLINRLRKYYSFVMSNDDTAQSKVIENTINLVTKNIADYLWSPLGDEETIKPFVNKNKILIIPNNINEILVDYIEFINS